MEYTANVYVKGLGTIIVKLKSKNYWDAQEELDNLLKNDPFFKQ